MKRWSRKKFLTNRHVQIKYLGLLLISMFVPMIFVGTCLYYLIFSILADRIGIPEIIAYNLFPAISTINFILLIGVPPLLIVLLVWGILMSHKFAGPLERLEKELDTIIHSGDYSKRIVLRKGDDIKSIADSINRLLEKLERKVR